MHDSSTKGIALAATVQFTAFALAFAAFFIGLASFLLTPRGSRSLEQGTDRFAVAKELPKLGTTEVEVSYLWGSPDVQGENWVSYKTTTSTLVFCLEDENVKKIVETKEEDQLDAEAACRS